MNRRAFIRLIGGLVIAWPLACHAREPQQPMKRIGVLAVSRCPIAPGDPLHRRLAELGWVEGRNFVFDCVSTISHLDELPALAHELVTRRPDVLMAGPAIFIMPLKQATTTIPIVMFAPGVDPVRYGLVTNLARPEGNVTGVVWFGNEILPKRIELLKEILPHLKRLAFIGGVSRKGIENGIAGFGALYTKDMEEKATIAAGALGFTWQPFNAVAANDFDEIFTRLASEHFDAAYILAQPLTNQNASLITELALRHRIPTIGESTGWAKGGLLLGYGQDYSWNNVRLAEYLDKILRGAKPSDLPVEQATKLELGINLKTAKELGLTVPPSLIARADEVIE
jgi:putative tryptophan/tyrosine transport system substrate-binding protein